MRLIAAKITENIMFTTRSNAQTCMHELRVAGKLIFLMVARVHVRVISFLFINFLNGIIFSLHPIAIVSSGGSIR